MTAWPDGGPGASSDSWREPPRADEPLSWSVPVARIGSTVIRAHALLLGTIVVIFVRAAWHAGEDAFPLGPRLAAILLGAMVFVVMVHELVTLVVTRRLGGHLPEIVLQPLGGLDDGVAPPGWRRAAVAAMVGPLSAATIAVMAAAAVAIGTRDVTSPRIWSLPSLHSPAIAGSPWLEALHLLGSVATVVAFANLLPAPPFRGRLLLDAMLRPHLGPTRARRATFRVGVTTTIVVAVAGIVSMWLPVFLVAALCGLALLREHRREMAVLEVYDDGAGRSIADLRADAALEQDEADAQADLERRRRRQLEDLRAAENAELDRVLDKIAAEGMDSLDRNERRILDQATRRRRDDRERPADGG